LFVGPVFTRELVTVPRRKRLYYARGIYVSALLLVIWTAWLVLAGTQVIRNVGDLSRFGTTLFQILAPLQLALAILFSALLAASAVAQEKDRRTLILLLLTNLSNCELVLGKLLAGMLNVLVLLTASLPVFMACALFGGVSFQQIGRVFAVTLASALACGSLGSTIALWREKTFQTLAWTVLALVFWLAAGESLAHGLLGPGWHGISSEQWAAAVSPWQAILAAGRPLLETRADLPYVGTPVNLFLLVSLGIAALVNGVAILRVRVWNPSQEVRASQPEDASRDSIWGEDYDARQLLAARAGNQSAPPPAVVSVHAAPGKTRQVWDNPILWREMRTWAYGRKILVLRLAYWVLFGLAAAAIHSLAHSRLGIRVNTAALVLVPLFVLSLVLVNAQAVTALTTERDLGALDLLLVTDVTAKEFVFGKLGGILYNTKEMVLLPMALCVYLWCARALSAENLCYLVGGLACMNAFVAMLGVHTGMAYTNSRSAIGVSLGTLFFLFIGIATCMRMMIAFSGSFTVQLQPFLAFMGGGWLGLFLALGARNPSPAIGLAAFFCPFITFYAITSFWLGHTLSVFLVLVFAYGFATTAMLIPAIYEFDVATGRTTAEE